MHSNSRLLEAAALLAVVAGCGKPLNMQKAEQVIRDDLTARLAASGLHLSAVSCPKEVRMRQGESFVCEASFEGGGGFRVHVDQTDSVGTINWRVTSSCSCPPRSKSRSPWARSPKVWS
jgi:hypothetical protein